MLDNFVIILSSPHYGGNVGSICRAMMNMGLSRLRIGNPHGTLFEDELRKMALGAVSIYEQREEFATVAEALADCTVVGATSARTGFYRDHAKTAREWAPEALAEAARGGTVGVLFGNEVSGLANEELKLATHIIQIPSSPEYTSLNLSKAVMVVAYELYAGADQFESSTERSELATTDMRERMYAMWRQTLLDVGFMKDDKSEHMMMGLRRILSRGDLTEKDVKIMMGIARQSQWAAKQGTLAEEVPSAVDEKDNGTPAEE